MTATDELCRMLDERGVEYETYIEPLTGFEHVKWNFNEHGSADFNLEFGVPWLTMYGTISGPEQAIAATLGDVSRLPHFWTYDGTLHIELPKLPETISVCLPDVRDREVGSARVWQYTLGAGTCHKLPASGEKTCIVRHNSTHLMMEFGYWRCSECGCECFEGARYCMGCGRKVVDG